MTWALIEHRTVASAIETFTGLAGYDELMLVMRDLTASSSGVRSVQASIDNGSSYLTTSGDYVFVSETGTLSNQTAMGVHTGSATTEKSGALMISACTLATEKIATLLSRIDSRAGYIPTANDIDALRVINTAGDLSGGDIWLYGQLGANPWTLIEARAVNGVEDFTGLGSYNNLRVVIDDINTDGGTGSTRRLRVSTDNGSTFLSASGDYVNLNSDGTETDSTESTFFGSNATLARSGDISIFGFNLTAPKVVQRHIRSDVNTAVIPTSSALNAIRVYDGLNNQLSGNIYLYGRA